MKYTVLTIILVLGVTPFVKSEVVHPDHPWWDQSGGGLPGGEIDTIENKVVVDRYYLIEQKLWDYEQILPVNNQLSDIFHGYIESHDNLEMSISDDIPRCTGIATLDDWSNVDVTIPEYVEINGKNYSIVSIENRPFAKARTIEFPSSIRYIKSNSYSNFRLNNWIVDSACSAEFIFNEGLETIMDHVFCTADIRSLSFPSTLRYIGSEVAVDCPFLEKIEFNDGLSSIGAFSFSNCPSLTKVELPQTLQSLGRNTFNNCKNLEAIHLSRWIRNVNGFEEICNECPNIKEIIYDSRTPYPAKNCFNKVNKDECILYVPYQSAYRYVELEGWKDFKNIIEMPASSEIINPSELNQTSSVFDTPTDSSYHSIDGIKYDEWQLIPSGTIIINKGHAILKR